MIRTSRHKGLKRLYEDNDARGICAQHVAKLLNILATLNAATIENHMNLPSYRLHALQGELKGYWFLTVRANWRVTFRFNEPDAFDVDYIDYH